MKRLMLFLGLAASILAAAGSAADLEDEIERRWVGAWVLTGVETASDCSGTYTNTEVRGRLAASKGRYRFEPGELARVDKVNVKSDRVDLFLSLGEALLISRRDGPFELLDERTCKVQLMVDVPRSLLSRAPVEGADEVLRAAATSFATRSAAEASPQWNGRRRAAYPDYYAVTLASHAAWQAEQENARLAVVRERVTGDAAAVLARVVAEPAYLAGFAAGVEELRSWRPGSCSSLSAAGFSAVERSAPSARRGDTSENKAWRRGFRDGQELTWALAVLGEADDCFVPVPPLPEQGR